MRKTDSTINSILDKYDFGNKEQQDFKQAQSYIKSEPLLNQNKHARDIYNSKPWDGSESTHDSNLRMIIDTTPKPMNDPMSTFKAKRKRSSNDRLSTAKDISLDYKLNKSPEDKEKEKFREMYREKLLGPSMFLNKSSLSSIDFVGSLAGNKINASINQQTGKFDSPEMNNVRGKPLSKEHLKNCTDTNYFMNQVLNKQDILPPWIENQQSLGKTIVAFRANLDEMWFKWILNDSIMQNIVNRASTVDEILDYYEINISKITMEDNSLSDSDLNYIDAKVNLLNSEIRHYNLQCPSLIGHKHKLNKDKEIKDSYWRTLENFSSLIIPWFNIHKKAKRNSRLVDRNKLSGPNKVLKALSLKGSPEIHVNTEIDTKLHLWQAVKDIFKKDQKRSK
ncbi:hypothetical protein KGF54_000567 [Candida jiufengensis]|uniref:uncharacterized protein n=1 Tax=Candida jiufengensis TaxID=497108 RepID=UPI002224A456|nr:uncharacterized protein KGF54_000567 [Candida jiufengensis]KAI5956948.1 hypothetical protein KGF54_000567 [Candida jiufengensis]